MKHEGLPFAFHPLTRPRMKGVQLFQRCDHYWRWIVRSPKQCALCTKTGNISDFEADHILTRGYKCLRFELVNGICLCGDCHKWKHDNPLEFVVWLEGKYPGRWDQVNRLANTLSYSLDLEENLRILKVEYDRLQRSGRFQKDVFA